MFSFAAAVFLDAKGDMNMSEVISIQEETSTNNRAPISISRNPYNPQPQEINVVYPLQVGTLFTQAARQNIRPSLEPWVIHDHSEVACEFNVMPHRPVKETLYVREYRIHDLYGEATFDREYFSSMEKSPDHLIMLTAQAHTQKLKYLVLAKYFGFTYSPSAKESLKIWPTELSIRLPRMVRDTTGVTQKLWVTELKHLKGNTYQAKITTTFNDIVEIDAVSTIYLI